MTNGKIIYYDETFTENMNRLKELLEKHDRKEIHRFLIDRFGFIFKVCQYYSKNSLSGVPEFEEADEDTKRELMRPLSHRQYRLLEGSFSPWQDEEWLVNSSFWDFLDDGGTISSKKVMSVAEVSACAVIYENVCVSLARTHRHKRPQ